MKRFISKVKKATRDFLTNQSAFSLVELIVVIAIMAVMAAVLAPALLGYVERSRAQKDNSATSEIVQSVQLALADFDVYDELLEHSVYDNVSCYIDTDNESVRAANKVTLKSAYGSHKEQYMFDDDARLLDEVNYWAAGNMRGLTITFSPDKASNGDTYNLKDGIINKFVGRKTGYLHENPELYNRIRSVIGDTLETTSQTYRNSDYTLFIQLGTTGGAEAVAQDAIKVWGQFSGTNLDENPNSFKLTSDRSVGDAGKNDYKNNELNDNNTIFDELYEPKDPALNHSDIIPANATYTRYNGTVLTAGQKFPDTPKTYDTYKYGDYIYTFNKSNVTTGEDSNIETQWIYDNTQDGWHVQASIKTKTEYGEILESIAGKYVTNAYSLFANCSNMIESPSIPKRITDVSTLYYNCSNLKKAATIDHLNVKTANAMFFHCSSLVTYNGSTDNDGDFSGYIIPNTVTHMRSMFIECESLTNAPNIPSSVINMYCAFSSCNNLTGSITINANPTYYDFAFSVDRVSNDITLTGSSSKLSDIAKTAQSAYRKVFDQNGNKLN